MLRSPSYNFSRFHSSATLHSLNRRFFHNRVVLLGAPGTGKGSYASRAAKLLKVPHLTTGDLIRHEIAAESDLGREFQEYTLKGLLVPDELVIEMVKSALDKHDKSQGFILDGFPRTLAQAAALDQYIDLHKVVNLTQREDIIVRKISSRRVCSKCGHTYNFAHIKEEGIDMPPLLPSEEGVCDTCGEIDSLIQRDDDKEDVVKHRLQVYGQETEPLIDYYKKKNLLVDFPVMGGVHELLPHFISLISDDGRNNETV
mmetsp:Transcript_10219/g.37969  ORF Transcript_10219/g.37969 Transcript_10219/m.37969 type:complete len:257 (-) Transcript_10219:191-961(-)|eukprot:CAMPEP_0117440426 /NCGR_PEP_ID=MMETSP0759-20121206/3091_1 /TAXON_ID=63605 /ORGANISM="Percolomonas cosmopolitus, Strain WS" /LENGTH=256 /DNA_ID=CAMNT_0005232205 /DNA_START=193 /DNA_END=963 /DNA_ORIENTATION=-